MIAHSDARMETRKDKKNSGLKSAPLLGSTRESSNAHAGRCYDNAKVPLSLMHVAWIVLASIGTANIKIIDSISD